MNWQEAQHQDELVRQQQIDEILRAAETRPLQQEEIRILAAEAGVGENYPKRIERN